MNVALLCDFLCGLQFWKVFSICLVVYILLVTANYLFCTGINYVVFSKTIFLV